MRTLSLSFFFSLAGEPLPGLFSMSHTQLLTHPYSPITRASSGDTRYHDCNVSRERFQRTSTPKLTPMSFSHSAQKQVHSLENHWVHVIFNAIWHTEPGKPAAIGSPPHPQQVLLFFFLYINTCCLKKITHNASKQDN